MHPTRKQKDRGFISIIDNDILWHRSFQKNASGEQTRKKISVKRKSDKKKKNILLPSCRGVLYIYMCVCRGEISGVRRSRICPGEWAISFLVSPWCYRINHIYREFKYFSEPNLASFSEMEKIYLHERLCLNPQIYKRPSSTNK